MHNPRFSQPRNVREFQFFGPRGPPPITSTTTTVSQPQNGQQRFFPAAAPNASSQPPIGPESLSIPTVQSQPRPPLPSLSFSTYDVASLSGLAGYSPDQFQHCFGQAVFNIFKVDQLKAIIRYIRDLYYKQRLQAPRNLIMNGRKQTLIDGLVEFVTLTAKPCTLHSAARTKNAPFSYTIDSNALKACTCYPSDEAARNAAAIADSAVLKALTEIPDFRRIEGLYSDIEILASAFLRGSGSVHIQFRMDPQKLAQVQSGAYRIFLRRFCPHSSKYEVIDNRILVRINGQTIIVPPQQFDTKKNPKPVTPIDISGWVRNGDQHVFVSSHIIRSVITVQFVRMLSVAEVVEMVKKKDEIPEKLASDVSKDSDDDDIKPSNMLVSLRCPLSMIRMNIPATAITCDHVQCFDLESVISYCKQYNRWTCPICCSPIKHDDVRIDSFFKRVLDGAGPDIDQANIGVDGSIQYIDPETERKKQEAMQERLLKRRRLSEDTETVQYDDRANAAVMDAAVMDGSSYDCPFVID